MFKKILIANRGEIALRIIRACRELGVKTVAVYSQADEQSLHVQLADEAICIGPAPSRESYLRVDRIIAAAEISNVDAIHPGYGFLSENAGFAEKCKAANIAFIGPDPESIRKMGDKAEARKQAMAAKVPCVPGSDGTIANVAEALKVAQKIGFPVIIKATAGGGGKGMRIAHNAAAFAKEFDSARIEAEKAFGNGSVYVEKYIEEPRHIEIQILADHHGNVVHLGERDCSVQRRHQKLIEEAPSPFLDKKLREEMGKVAVGLAKNIKYRNAGTIEFLVDKNKKFYFMEMNTRIQVEHGVTEEVYDLDLVKRQIRIAAGEKLDLSQKDLDKRATRHAIEVRINAEDPARNFAPCPGTIGLYYAPGGHGVRVDSHVYSGYVIPAHYDSMIGKLIAYGETRELALDRMYRALGEYTIRGIHTTAPFARAIMKDPVFRAGGATTKYIEDYMTRVPKENWLPETPSH